MNRPIATLTQAAALATAVFLTGPATRAALAQAPATTRPAPARPAEPRPEPKPQPRPHGTRVPVDPARVVVDDGDTFVVRWSKDDVETVRILGIDTPETRHLPHDLPYAQSFGPEAAAFARGAFAAATQVELLRSSTLDPYGRTLGYVFLNSRNYSVLVVEARFSAETVTFYGDNGLEGGSRRGAGRVEDGGPSPLRAAPRLPGPHARAVEVDEGEGARGRAVGR